MINQSEQFNINYSLQVIKPEGKLVYEYNPLYNYRLNKDAYLKDSEGNYLDAQRNKLSGVILPTTKDGTEGYGYIVTINKETGIEEYHDGDPKYKSNVVYEEDGMLQDLITGGTYINEEGKEVPDKDYLGFDLNHPVDIQCQESYDGSVNLILNDNKNIPRLINTRFTPLENNTYERRDRKGNTDTNIYDASEFDIDSSLFKRYNNVPVIQFVGVQNSGDLKVGNYVFYFKLADADGNETDFFGESGIVSIYMGNVNDPISIRGGQQNENAHKSVRFNISNIDSAYDYVTVYYIRYTGQDNAKSIGTSHKILSKYRVESEQCNIYITGTESIQDISLDEINREYFMAHTAKAQAVCQNRLFLGNVTKQEINYTELQRISLGFMPFYQETPAESLIGLLQYDYTDIRNNKNEYYNPKNIYNYVGYWPEEVYRFGVVYVMDDNTLSPVFNIRGIGELPNIDTAYKEPRNKSKYMAAFQEWDDPDSGVDDPVYTYNPKLDYDDYIINKGTMENAAGVVQFPKMQVNTAIYDKIVELSNEKKSESSYGNLPIYSLKVRASEYTVKELLKHHIKGYFFVRQKRIPTILAQAFTMPVDSKSGTPLIWNKTPTLKASIQRTLESKTDDEIKEIYRHQENFELSDEYLFESFLTVKGALDGDFHNRILKVNKADKQAMCAICPEYELDQPYYNTLFTGGSFTVRPVTEQQVFCQNDRQFYTAWYNSMSPIKKDIISKVNIITVPDSSQAIRNNGFTFRTKAGNAEDIKYLSVGTKVSPEKDNFEHFKKKKKSWWEKTWRILSATVLAIIGIAITILSWGSLSAVGVALSFTAASLLITNAVAIEFGWYSMEVGLWINIGASLLSFGTSIASVGALGSTAASVVNSMGTVYNVVTVANEVGMSMGLFCAIIGSVASTTTVLEAVLLPNGMDGDRVTFGEDESDSYVIKESQRDPVNMYNETSDEYGEAQEEEGEWKKNKVKIVRGAYGPLLGITNNKTLKPNQLINIYNADAFDMSELERFTIRINDQSPYYAITPRIPIDLTDKAVTTISGIIDKDLQQKGISQDKYYTKDCLIYTAFRGDCYISTFTHRLNRNFQDPDAPNNDIVVDPDSWRDNWNVKDGETSKVNRGDVNAVELGTWITFKCYTSMNTALRDTDPTNPNEEALTGNKRTFYPYTDMCTSGNYKIPESAQYCQGFSVSTGSKSNYILPEVPYLKNTYQTRIMYSNPAPTDSFQNGFRDFQLQAYRDYSNQYGGIIKLVSWRDNLIVVFEHAIALLPINQQTLLQASDTQIAVGAAKLIPDTLTIISDTYGSQWADSVITSERYIYGVDTIAKKIWRTDGQQIDLISDLRVQKFLNDNITLGERELSPIIGIRNVKSHFNTFKNDIMFTFYDNTIGFEETAWNLCFNETQNIFVTLYSWIPSFSANIDNIFFSYDRDASKWISKLATSNGVSSSGDGIVLYRYGNCKDDSNYGAINISDWETEGKYRYCYLDLKNRIKPADNSEIIYKFELLRDNFRNDQYFEIIDNKLMISNARLELLKKALVSKVPQIPVVQLNIACTVSIKSKNLSKSAKDYEKYFSYNAGRYQSQVFITFEEVLDRKLHILNGIQYPKLRTDFWKHGQSGIIDIKERIKPCYWYGKQHPFEFEYVVGNSSADYKQFTNNTLFTNKVFPESIHYTLIGDSYDFAEDKKNMYIRQEATKAFFQYNGSDILYNHHTFDQDYGLLPEYSYSSNYIEQATNGRYLRGSEAVSSTYKATIFPLLYTKEDTFNEIEDYYRKYVSPIGKDYPNLAGTELIWDENLNQFSLCNHVKVRDIKKVGRMRGNCQYVNDTMDLQITPIYLYNKNEIWKHGVPPILAYNIPQGIYTDYGDTALPPELTAEEYILKQNNKPYTLEDIEYGDWSTLANGRKEIKLMDKYLKIRVRYPGDNLTLVMATKTIFNTMS